MQSVEADDNADFIRKHMAFANGLLGMQTASKTEIARLDRSPLFHLLHKLFPSKSSVIQKFEDEEVIPKTTYLHSIVWMIYLFIVAFILLFVVYKVFYFVNCYTWKKRELTFERIAQERQYAMQCTGEFKDTKPCLVLLSDLHESIANKSVDFALHMTLDNTELYVASKRVLEVVVAAALPWMSVLVPVLIVCLAVVLLAFASHVYKTAVFGMAQRDFQKYKKMQ